MLEGAAWVVKTRGVIYTEHLLAHSFESLWYGNKSKTQIEVTDRGGLDGRQARPLDPAHVAGAQDDRAVYGPAGARRSDQLRSVVVRLRYSSGGRVPNFHEREFDDRGPEAFRSEIVRGVQGRRVHHSAEFVCAGAVGGIFPDTAERADDLPGQIDVCAMRDHRECDAVRAGVGRFCDSGNQQYDAAAGKDLCE